MTDVIRGPLLLLAILVFPCANAFAQSPPPQDLQKQFDVDIERMGVTAAIHKFSDQTGLNVGFFPESDEQEQTQVGPAQGRFTAEAALATLFEGTEFKFEWLNEKSLYVFVPEQGAGAGSPPNPPDPSTATSQSHSNRRAVESRTVIVIASKLDSPMFPSTTGLHEETIESYGVATVAELLSYVPQVPSMRAAAARVGGEQSADLRGFGDGSTIILLNGRRVGATATSFESSSVDLNSIPLAAVKRIEIYLDAHPIAYGADAMGGAINIVLKDEIPEPVVQARYGAAAGGAEEARGSVAFGISSERVSANAILDYFQREFLFGSARDITNNQDFRRFGRADLRSIDADPPNISSVIPGRNLPGLNSPFAAVPPGVSNPTIDDFKEGERNLTNANQFRSIVPQSKRMSGVGNIQWHVSEHAEIFGEVMFVDRTGVFQFGPQSIRGVVPAANPHNLFGESVQVNALVVDAAPTTYVTDTSLLRGVLGASATFDGWTVDAWTVRHEESAQTWQENELDPMHVMRALNATDPDSALNLFRDGPPGSSTLLRSLRADRAVAHFESEYLQAHVSTQGSAVSVPGGEVRLLLGGEWQQEGLATPALSPLPALRSQRRTASAFGEVRVPIVSPDMQVPGANTIDLWLGLRGDHGDFGTGVSAQYVVSWIPVSKIQTSVYYRDFNRQPNLYDLRVPSAFAGNARLPDPRRNNELTALAIVVGGNDALVPTAGQVWGGGIEYEASDGLSISARYWRTAIQDRISYLPLTFALVHESQFPSLVKRADPTPQDIANGVPGALISVNVRPGNYGDLQADGIDLAVKGFVATRFGRLSPAFTATWNHSYTTSFGTGSKAQQRVGIANEGGTIPRWRGVVSVGWERGPWSIFCATRFVAGYDDASLGGVANGRSIPSSMQIDAQASMNLTKKLRGLKLTIGATNLLNEAPSYSEVFGSLGYDLTQADLRQRLWYLSAEKSF